MDCWVSRNDRASDKASLPARSQAAMSDFFAKRCVLITACVKAASNATSLTPKCGLAAASSSNKVASAVERIAGGFNLGRVSVGASAIRFDATDLRPRCIVAAYAHFLDL